MAKATRLIADILHTYIMSCRSFLLLFIFKFSYLKGSAETHATHLQLKFDHETSQSDQRFICGMFIIRPPGTQCRLCRAEFQIKYSKSYGNVWYGIFSSFCAKSITKTSWKNYIILKIRWQYESMRDNLPLILLEKPLDVKGKTFFAFSFTSKGFFRQQESKFRFLLFVLLDLSKEYAKPFKNLLYPVKFWQCLVSNCFSHKARFLKFCK